MGGQGCAARGHGHGPCVVRRVRHVVPSQVVPEGVGEWPEEAGVAGGGGCGWGRGPLAVVGVEVPAVGAAHRVTWCGTVGSATQVEVLIRAWGERVRWGEPSVLLLLCCDGATNVENGLARMVMQGVKHVRRKEGSLLCDAASPVEYRMPRWEAWAAML